MLELRLFGTGQARYYERLLPGFPNLQPYHLLCYLLLNRHKSHPREHLAATFWGEYSTSTSRKYLRNALWRLRHALGSVGAPAQEYLLVRDDSLFFPGSGAYWLDVEAFEAAVTNCQGLSSLELTSEQVDRLEEAVDLYTGDLLEGVYEDWCLYDREKLHLLYLDTLGKLMVFHEVNGTYDHGLAYGERILACDDTRENVHQHMMRLYWLLGDRGAALAQYKLCAQILRDKLGVPPLENTTRLYRRMRSGRVDSASWSGEHGLLPDGVQSDRPTRLLVEQALRKLHRLQATMEQAGLELRRIEEQLRALLSKS